MYAFFERWRVSPTPAGGGPLLRRSLRVPLLTLGLQLYLQSWVQSEPEEVRLLRAPKKVIDSQRGGAGEDHASQEIQSPRAPELPSSRTPLPTPGRQYSACGAPGQCRRTRSCGTWSGDSGRTGRRSHGCSGPVGSSAAFMTRLGPVLAGEPLGSTGKNLGIGDTPVN